MSLSDSAETKLTSTGWVYDTTDQPPEESDTIEGLAQKLGLDPVKLKAISKWEPPKTVKQVQSFLGFGNFYRRFI